MSVPAEYDATTKLPRDVYSILYEGWSPSEIHGLDSACDVLHATQQPLSVVGRLRLRLQPSMSLLAFDALHHFWDPTIEPSLCDRRAALSSSNITALASDITDSGSLHSTSAAPSASQVRGGPQRFVDPMQQLFLHAQNEGVVMKVSSSQSRSSVSDDSQLFRVVVHCEGGRRYFLERTSSHIASLLTALRFSFPHLAVPFLTDSATINGLRLVLSFLLHHGWSLSTYIPVQYFLFEENAKAFHSVFPVLQDMVRTRIQNDDALMAQAKPKVSKSWFSFGGSKGDVTAAGETFGGPQMTKKEDIDFIERDERLGKQLPERFRVKYAFVSSVQEAVSEAFECSRVLETCFLEEGAAWESLAEALTHVQATLTDDAVPGWGPIASSDDVSSSTSTSASTNQDEPVTANVAPAVASTAVGSSPVDTSATKRGVDLPLRLVSNIVKGYTTVCCVMQNQVTVPMASSLRLTMGEAELAVNSSRQFLRSMVLHAKFVFEKEGIVSGRDTSVRESPAGTNPSIMQAIKELYAKRRSDLRLQKQCMPDELARWSQVTKHALAHSCTVLFSLIHHLVDAHDARHYQDLLRRFASVARSHRQATPTSTAAPPLSQSGKDESPDAEQQRHPLTQLLLDVPLVKMTEGVSYVA